MNILSEFLKSQNKTVVLAEQHNNSYTKLDLSVSNEDLSSTTCSDSYSLGTFINNLLLQNDSQMAFGGYNEERAIYKRSNIFNDQQSDERNIHIGLDLWAPAKTAVFSAFDGEIHSFAYNQGQGNYGPTIILKHHFDSITFYTLYGHLDLECLHNLQVGRAVRKGEQIAVLGDESVNGDYPAHLHFQIIHKIDKYKGDYPGVCTKKEREYYLTNCPDPNLLLKINL